MKLYEKYIKIRSNSVYTVTNGAFFGFFKKFYKTDLALVCIHGGPGYPHNYLRNIFDLNIKLPIIMYDQAGSGKSREAFGQHCFDIGYYPDELEEIRKFYKVSKLILYGHSWGSIVAYEYYMKYPNSVSSIIFSSPCLSIPYWIKDAKRSICSLSASPHYS